MKKIIVILVAAMLFAGGEAFAQLSVNAGYAYASLVSRASLSEAGEKAAFGGVYAGAGYTLRLAGGISFIPGVYYEYLARSEKSEGRVLDFIGETREHYLGIPLSFNYGVELFPGIRFLLFAGPTLRIGLDSVTSYSIGWSVRDFEVIKGGLGDHNYNNGDYSRFDILLGGGLAVELLDRYRLQIGFDRGLLNRYTGETEGTQLHGHRMTAGVAFLF
ncbi:MAG: PorT family protein [Bacteroidales bacterium]|jgi:hypothetical protein|nr:PorT family protein [Bacteroidales bacterium]